MVFYRIDYDSKMKYLSHSKHKDLFELKSMHRSAKTICSKVFKMKDKFKLPTQYTIEKEAAHSFITSGEYTEILINRGGTQLEFISYDHLPK